MDLPRNATQMGEMNREYKVYIEDYVISYLKQLENQLQEGECTVAFYGKSSKGEGENYYIIYGAVKIESITQKIKHLSQAQLQEIERSRRKYFHSLSFCGYCIFSEYPIPEILIWEGEVCVSVLGYARFYEKNDCMLEILLSGQTGEQENNEVELAKYRQVKDRQEARKQHYLDADVRGEKNGTAPEGYPERKEFFPGLGTALVFLLFCAAIFLAFSGEKGRNIKTKVSNLANTVLTMGQTEQDLSEESAEETKNPEDSIYGGEKTLQELVEETEGSKIMKQDAGTIVTDPALSQVILDENRKALEGTQRLGDEGQNSLEETQRFGDEGQNSLEGMQKPLNEGENPLEGMQKSLEEPIPALGNADDRQVLQGEADIEKQTEPAEKVQTESEAKTLKQTEEKGIKESGSKENTKYEIQKGDTLIGICINRYGSDKRVKEICELNHITNPDNIQMGQKILLP